MNYDFKKIGERIKKERKLRSETQEVFAENFKVKRSTVGKWEKGETIPSFQTMIDMCKLFDCEMGYLLCEPGYESKTRTTTDVCAVTGLSAAAVDKLSVDKQMQCIINEIVINGESISYSTNAILHEQVEYAEITSSGNYKLYKAIYDEIQKDWEILPHERESVFYEMLEDAFNQYETQRVKEVEVREEEYRRILSQHNSSETVQAIINGLKNSSVDMGYYYVSDIYKRLDTDYKHREKVYMMDIKDSFTAIIKNYIDKNKERINAAAVEKMRKGVRNGLGY